MVTSIDGIFTEFTGEYTHTSELGGMETSLIKKINTYIIQKQIGTGEIGYDFLANSKSDENYYMLFNSSNGNSTFVNRANYTVVNMPTPENPVLNVSMEDYTGQWVIISIEDPYNNLVPIKKVIRTRDGTEIPSYNYWMRNGRILIVDHYEEGFDGKYTIKYDILEPPAPGPLEPLRQLKSDGITQLNVGDITNERTVIFSAYVNDSNGSKLKLQVELRRLDEYGGNFDETKGGLKEGDFVASGSTAKASAIELIDGNYHWRARTVDEHGNTSEWVEFGNNPTSSIDFTVLKNKFKFVQLSDVHLGPDPEECFPKVPFFSLGLKECLDNSRESSAKKLSRIIEDIIKNQTPDFIIITGDLVEWNNKNRIYSGFFTFTPLT